MEKAACAVQLFAIPIDWLINGVFYRNILSFGVFRSIAQAQN